eukprot:9490200-Pyramimonas_sp.AAC.1
MADLLSLWEGASTACWDCAGQTAGIWWLASAFRANTQQHRGHWPRKWRTTVAEHSGNFAFTVYLQWSRLSLIVGPLTTALKTRR